MQDNIKQFNTLQFSFSKETKAFTAEASTLQTRPGLFMNELSRLYVGGTDKGFKLVSHATNKEVVCAWHRTDKDQEGDIIAWVFKPVLHEHDFTVVIFND